MPKGLPALLAGLALGSYSGKRYYKPLPKVVRPTGRTALFHKRGKAPQFRKGRPAVVVRNDGSGNQTAGSKIGKSVGKLSTAMEKKIRYALQPQNSHLFKRAGRVVASLGQGNFSTHSLNDVEDISTIVDVAGGSDQFDDKNGRIHIKDSSLNVTYTNMDAGLVQIRVYEMVYRRDVPKSQLDLNSMVLQGFQQQQGTGATNTEYTDASVTLFNNPLVCTYARITKVRNVLLGAGKSFKLTMNQVKGRDINPILFGLDESRDIIALGGFTRAYVIQVIGQNVSDSANSATVTTSNCHLAYTEERRYHWSQPYSGSSLITTTGAFGTITASPNMMSTSGYGNVVADTNC